MKKLTFTTLGLITSLSISAHYQWASHSKKSAVCQEMRMNKHSTSARKCFGYIRNRRFDDVALEVCREMAMNEHSLSSLKCLKLISGKHYKVLDSRNCLGFAEDEDTKTAFLCLNQFGHY